MAQEREATETDVKDFDRNKKLHVPVDKALRHVAAKELMYVASSFTDPGPDCTQLITKAGEAIGFWSGF